MIEKIHLAQEISCMDLILIGKGKITTDLIKRIQSDSRFNLIGVIPDSSLKGQDYEDFLDLLDSLKVRHLQFEEMKSVHADIILAIVCSRILPLDFVKEYFVLNIHAGILPKWRGFSANPWALINGEDEVGFTLHRMNEKMDDGDIYYVDHIPVAENEMYERAHSIILRHIVDKIPDLLVKIHQGEIQGEKQLAKEMHYCSKFSPSMGVLTDFNVDSDYIVNLYRCMARPLGSGIFIKYKERLFEVGKVEHGKIYGVSDYIGIPGKIVNVEDGKIMVKTKDNCVALSDIKDEFGKEQVTVKFMIGYNLNS